MQGAALLWAVACLLCASLLPQPPIQPSHSHMPAQAGRRRAVGDRRPTAGVQSPFRVHSTTLRMVRQGMFRKAQISLMTHTT